LVNICIELLNSFTKKEQTELKQFIQAGIFNTDKRIIDLYNELNKHVINKSDFNEKIQTRIYNIVFRKNYKIGDLKKNNKKKLNALMSSLTRYAEDYLIFKFLQNNYNSKKEILYKVLLEKKQIKLITKHLKNDKKKLDKVTKKGNTYYDQVLKIENKNLQVMYITGLIAKQDNINEINNNLDIHYILQKLNLWNSMLSLEQLTHRQFDYSSFKIVENYINNSSKSKVPAIIISIAMIDLLEYKTEKNYNKLLDLLNQYEDVIGNEILINGYNIATNFCSYNIKRGLFSHKHLLKLYQILDDKYLLLEDAGFMPVIKLKNLVAVACRTKEFSWAEQILEKYLENVNKSFKKSVYAFNYGVINFYQNKYNIALQNFIRVDDVNLVYDINCRIMMMKAHYEVDDTYDERTLQIFRSAEKYFGSNKLISSNNRTAYKNFVRMLINLYRIKHEVTKMKLSSFTDKLNNQKLNQDKNWLLLKLEEIRELNIL